MIATPPLPSPAILPEPSPDWLRQLQSDLPADIRLPELRAMFRSAGPRGIAWDSLVRRFGARDATLVLSVLQAHGLLETAEVEGRFARTAGALSWIESTMRTEFSSENVRAALRGLVARARTLRASGNAPLVPARVLACSELPSRSAERAKRVDIHVVLLANEQALAAARADAQGRRTVGIRTRMDEAAWLAARRRATLAYLAGGTPMLRLSSGDGEVAGAELFPDGAWRWLQATDRRP